MDREQETPVTYRKHFRARPRRKDILSPCSFPHTAFQVFSQCDGRYVLALQRYQCCRLTTTELTPLARAILSRSAFDLEHEITLNPESLTERHRGLTALQLCTGWPEGLERLLNTKATELLDLGNRKGDTGTPAPIYMAFRLGCFRSADLLLKAGCALSFDPEIDEYNSSHECMAVLLLSLAERRRDLLQICQKELGIHLDQDLLGVPDELASALCAALSQSGIPIPRRCLVPPDYSTIFHGIPVDRFEELWTHGFHGIRSHDFMGRTPYMVWRPLGLSSWHADPSTPLGRRMAKAWCWIRDMGHLDQIQQDPLALGLNESSTGWHAMAAELGFSKDLCSFGSLLDSPMTLSFEMLHDFSQSIVRDKCVCWCNPQGLGCSALKSFWKAYASAQPVRPDSVGADLFWRHCLLHHHLNAEHVQDRTRVEILRSTALEYVRLLTFETLDMTHTCCYLEEVENLQSNTPSSPAQRKEMSKGPNWHRWEKQHVIAGCSPDLVQEIRSDVLEQQDAQQLDALMREFEPQIMQLELSNPKYLENFIWGPWRERISSLFAVDAGAVAEMEKAVGQVALCK